MTTELPVAATVIIPAFNAAATIGGQLAALGRQTFDRPWDVIVADDGSTDDTVAVVSRVGSTVPGVKLINSPQPSRPTGPAATRNRGAGAARGAILAFCDADDEVDEGWLSALVGSCQEVDAAAGRLDYQPLNEPDMAASWPAPWSTGPLTIGDRMLVSTANCAVSRAVFDELGGFNEHLRYAEDCEFFLRLQQRGYQLSYTADAVVAYRLRSPLRQSRVQFRFGVAHARVVEPLLPGAILKPESAQVGRALRRATDLVTAQRRMRLLADVAFEAGLATGRLRRRIDRASGQP